MFEYSNGLVIRGLSAESAVVFGLEWESLIGSKLEKQSQQRAAELSATHYIRAGRHSTSFGHATLKGAANKGKGRKLYSAAAIFAQTHPQGVFWECKEMEAGSVWLVASQDGVVITDTDLVCSREDADEIIHALRVRYPHIVQVSERDELDYVYYLNDRTLMVEVTSFIDAIPTPVKVVAAVLLGLMVIDIGWDQFKSYQARMEQEKLALSQSDVERLWAQALDEWQSRVFLVGADELQDAYTSLVNIPLKIGHWNLTSAGCDATVAGWNCEASYKRSLGTSISFKTFAPENWSITWNGLDGATGRWKVPFKAPVLDRTTLKANGIGLDYISELQSVLPAFELYTLFPPEKPAIEEPSNPNSKGGRARTYPHPNNGNPLLAIPSFQRFRVEAPLRSINLLPSTEQLAFEKIQFTYGVAGSQSLTKSMFKAILTGRIYVK